MKRTKTLNNRHLRDERRRRAEEERLQARAPPSPRSASRSLLSPLCIDGASGGTGLSAYPRSCLSTALCSCLSTLAIFFPQKLWETDVKSRLLAQAVEKQEKEKAKYEAELRKSKATNRKLILQFTLVQVASLYAVRRAADTCTAARTCTVCRLASAGPVSCRACCLATAVRLKSPFPTHQHHQPFPTQPSVPPHHLRPTEVPDDHRELNLPMARAPPRFAPPPHCISHRWVHRHTDALPARPCLGCNPRRFDYLTPEPDGHLCTMKENLDWRAPPARPASRRPAHVARTAAARPPVHQSSRAAAPAPHPTAGTTSLTSTRPCSP